MAPLILGRAESRQGRDIAVQCPCPRFGGRNALAEARDCRLGRRSVMKCTLVTRTGDWIRTAFVVD